MVQNIPSYKEDHISQIPALKLLVSLGYTYIDQNEALKLRGGRPSEVLLKSVLDEQLKKINRIRFKGGEYEFSDSNIKEAIRALDDMPFDGLVTTNERIYDLLCLGKSQTQIIDGDKKSFTLKYIDWEQPENNAYHVSEEFVVSRKASYETRRPDIVLFVNGIPLCVIECKRPDVKDSIDQAISQHLRNQHADEIPRLFQYSQLLLSISKNEAKYATAGTPAKFWAVWREEGAEALERVLAELVNKQQPPEQHTRLFSSRFKYVRNYFEHIDAEGRAVTEQDRALYELCRPERLLELTHDFSLFDAGERKIARYQQYFCIKKILRRVRELQSGQRKGGVVWHTQGSGKSLTMVMLAKLITSLPGITDYKIVLVTDRVDLDTQLYKTFSHCGTEVEQAATGTNLNEMLKDDKARIIATVINKFDAAVTKHATRNESHNIFVLVDEGHRTQFGSFHAKMRKALPNACLIAFTGTPVMKKNKDTVDRFGGLIHTYTITQAVEDKAVVPLLYEGRHVDQKVDRVQIDSWFDKLTQDLTSQQAEDLKRKFATSEQLNQAEQKVMRVAWDIGEHFRDNWQGTDMKAQLVTPNKATALMYKKFLDEFGHVSSEVLLSPPDDREGEENIYDESSEVVKAFWKKMMARFGSEKQYNDQLISKFKGSEDPEIIIVVDKLLTGFDAPRNSVLYLTRSLKDHTLLQAIARVNRLFEGKEFGYIVDYRGVLQNLDKALDLYGQLEEFDAADLENILTDISEEVGKLAQRHSSLWSLFAVVANKLDAEAYEEILSDEELRNRFYDGLSAYGRCLAIAFSSVRFLEETPENRVAKYKTDLVFFMKLRDSVRRRYAEVVDFKEYENRIQQLINKHVGTGEVEQVTKLVNIFNEEAFAQEVARLATPSSKADTIAHRTKRTISELMGEDPAYYKRFSDMLEAAIRDYRQKRLIDAAEYLRRVEEISQAISHRTGDDIPSVIADNNAAKAYFGVVSQPFAIAKQAGNAQQKLLAEAALKIDELIQARRIVNWTTNTDVQNQMRNDIEDYLFELMEKAGLKLSFEQIDGIMDQCLEIASVRFP